MYLKKPWNNFWSNYFDCHEKIVDYVIENKIIPLKTILKSNATSYLFNINFADYNKYTPLHFAAMLGHVECGEILI